MLETLTPGFYECPVGSRDGGEPVLRAAMIDDDGGTWIEAKRIPDRLIAKVWPHLRACEPERYVELLKARSR